MRSGVSSYRCKVRVTRGLKRGRVISHTGRRTMMEIGPLEYVVLGFEDDQFANEVLPELNAIQASDLIGSWTCCLLAKRLTVRSRCKKSTNWARRSWQPT